MAQRPGKPRLAPAQREGAGLFGDRRESRVGDDQLRKAGLEIGFGVEEVGHCPLVICRWSPRKRDQLSLDWIPAYAGMSGESHQP